MEEKGFLSRTNITFFAEMQRGLSYFGIDKIDKQGQDIDPREGKQNDFFAMPVFAAALYWFLVIVSFITKLKATIP